MYASQNKNKKNPINNTFWYHTAIVTLLMSMKTHSALEQTITFCQASDRMLVDGLEEVFGARFASLKSRKTGNNYQISYHNREFITNWLQAPTDLETHHKREKIMAYNSNPTCLHCKIRCQFSVFAHFLHL